MAYSIVMEEPGTLLINILGSTREAARGRNRGPQLSEGNNNLDNKRATSRAPAIPAPSRRMDALELVRHYGKERVVEPCLKLRFNRRSSTRSKPVLRQNLVRRRNARTQRRLFVHVLARTRVIYDTLCAEIRDGAAVQVLVLGASNDTRAYRMQELLKRAIVFEVDLPPIQELKKLQLREVLDQVPRNVVFVPTDFTNGDLETVPPKPGYHAEQRNGN
jgi:Leucine carboxyl methyltransferase